MKRRLARSTALLLALGLLAQNGYASDTEANSARIRNEAAVSAALTRARAEANEDIMARRGIVADRRTHEVRILAEATGIPASEPLEFFVIGLQSGHDYEALAVSFASAADIDAGLRFVGMQPGAPVDYGAGRLWPRGERVHMTFEWMEGGEQRSYAAQDLMIDDRTGKPMSADGLVYVGSFPVADPATGEPRGLAADLREPYAIAANYNEPTSLLDVPFQAAKGQHYEHLSANREKEIPKGVLIEIVLRPEFTDGTRRVQRLRLEVTVPAEGSVNTASDLQVQTLADNDEVLSKAHGFEEALATFGRLHTEQKDLFVKVRMGAGVELQHARDIYQALAALEGERGVRLEPGGEGQLVHKAFLGSENFRNRDQRPSQPWELHLQRIDGKVTARLVLVTQTWNDKRGAFDSTVEEHPAATPADVRRIVDMREAALKEAGRIVPPVILAFPPADLPYGELMRYLEPLLPTHKVVYVFL